MKKIAVLTVLLCCVFIFGQDDPKRGEPITVTYTLSEIPDAKREHFKYPGCSGHLAGMEVSPCLTHSLNRDINALMNIPDIESKCATVVTTVNVTVNKEGKIITESITGENLTEDIKNEITKAIHKLDSLQTANGESIKPSRINGKAIEANYSFPLVIHGKGYHLYETITKDGETYKVFRSCDNYYVKKGDHIESIENFNNETDYLDFKETFLSNSMENMNVNETVGMKTQ